MKDEFCHLLSAFCPFVVLLWKKIFLGLQNCRDVTLFNWQLVINGLNFLGFRAVYFADVVHQDFLQRRGIEAVQATVGRGGKAPAFLVAPPCSRIKLLNAMLNAPFNGFVIAGIEM